MLKKLSEEKIEEILEVGISEFASHGLHATSMNNIAKRAGISVGVLYKYYADKNDFFLACLSRSLSALEKLLGELSVKEDDPLKYAEALIDAVAEFAESNSDHIRMYHEITTGEDRELAKSMAEHIEGVTSKLYTEIIARAQKKGEIRSDLNPELCAFFFDNLMMMLQFSYSCPYYQERYKLYRGRELSADNDIVKRHLLQILESAFR